MTTTEAPIAMAEAGSAPSHAHVHAHHHHRRAEGRAEGRAAGRAWGREEAKPQNLRLVRPGDEAGKRAEGAVIGGELPRVNLRALAGVSAASAAQAELKPTPEQAVARIVASLAREIGSARFERYFDGQAALTLVSPREEGGVAMLQVRVPSASLAGVLSRRFAEALHTAAREHVAGEVAVEIQVDAAGMVGGAASLLPRMAAVETGAEARQSSAAMPSNAARAARDSGTIGTSGGGRLSRVARYRLEDFIVGEANRLAYNAVTQMAEGLSEGHAVGGAGGFSTLVLHGLCGVGKTHLLQGAALRFKERHPGAAVRLTSGEQFMQEFVQAIRTQTVDRFRKTYRRVDLLCIDDIHFLADKKATQDEMLHTFDEIAGSGARVILACDEHPRDVKRMSDALRSRFVAGMVVRVDLPEAAMREKMAKAFAARRGLVLDDAAARAVADRTEHAGSVRDLEGLMLRIEATAKMLPGYISEDGRVGLLAVERTLADERPSAAARSGAVAAMVAGERGAAGGSMPSGGAARLGANAARMGGGGVLKPVRIEAIIEYVCLVMRVERGDLMGRGRHKRVVLARALISHIARALTTHSFPEIAKALGRPNHSTIITACQRLARQIQADEVLCDQSAPPMMSGSLACESGGSGGGLRVRELIRRLTEELVRRRG